MSHQSPEQRREQLITNVRHYFEACNEASREKFAEVLTEDCRHYFPPRVGGPYPNRKAIEDLWIRCVREMDSRWTIDRLVCDGDTVVVEWTHWKPKLGEYIRGSEWYEFDDEGKITEIWAHYASPRDPGLPKNELEGFPYVEKGYPTEPPEVPETETRRRVIEGELV